MRLRPVDLHYEYAGDQASVESPSAYEHLLLDALRGDPTFFARADEVEAAWSIVQPVLDAWEAEKPTDFPNYSAGAAVPAGADAPARE